VKLKYIEFLNTIDVPCSKIILRYLLQELHNNEIKKYSRVKYNCTSVT